MKKFLTIICMLAMFTSFASCGETADNSSTGETLANNSVIAENYEINEFEWNVNGNRLYYYVKIHNSNEDYCIKYPKFKVTAKDKDGIVLGTEEQMLSIIYPNQDFIYASDVGSVEEIPSEVNIEIVEPEKRHFIKESESEYSGYKPLTVINTTVRESGLTPKMVGEVQNDNDFAIEHAVIAIVYIDKDGKYIPAANPTFVDNISANSSVAFETSISKDYKNFDYEVYANIW
ncbi:MAG: hypothetical protein K2J08_01830 [Ruminococcus sp.]|nr:hypothetical protein [Ruminococcus sp.]